MTSHPPDMESGENQRPGCYYGNSSLFYQNTETYQGPSPLLVKSASSDCLTDCQTPATEVKRNRNLSSMQGTPGVNSGQQYDVITLDRLLQRPIMKEFVILKNTEKSNHARLATFSRDFLSRLSSIIALQSPLSKQDSINGSQLPALPNYAAILTRTDVQHPDVTGWLCEVESGAKRWCVMADILLSVFSQRSDDNPLMVVVLSRCRVIRIVNKSTVTRSEVKFMSRLPGTQNSDMLHCQFLIEDVFANKEFLFATETEEQLDHWVLMLKLASNLDFNLLCKPPLVDSDDIKCGESNELPLSIQRHKSRRKSARKYICHASKRRSSDENNNQVSRKSASGISPSFSRSRRNQDVTPQSGTRVEHTAVTRVTSCNPCRKHDSSDLECTIASIGSPSDSSEKLVRLRRKGSLERLRSLLQKKSSLRELSTRDVAIDTATLHKSTSTGTTVSAVTSQFTHEGKESCLSFPPSATDYSVLNAASTNATSMEYSRSLQGSGLAQKLAQKAYNFRTRLQDLYRRREHNDGHVTLNMLMEARIEGLLLRKYTLKWSNVWCVVFGGYFYEFKARDTKNSPSLSLLLRDCSIATQENAKQGHVFKLCQHNSRCICYQCQDEDTFAHWVKVLKEETSTYESFQSSPRAVGLDGQALTYWTGDVSCNVSQELPRNKQESSYGASHNLTTQLSISGRKSEEPKENTLSVQELTATTGRDSRLSQFLGIDGLLPSDRSTPHMMIMDSNQSTPIPLTPSQNQAAPLPPTVSRSFSSEDTLLRTDALIDDTLPGKVVSTLAVDRIREHNAVTPDQLPGSYLTKHPNISKCSAWALENYFLQQSEFSSMECVDSWSSQQTLPETESSGDETPSDDEQGGYPNRTYRVHSGSTKIDSPADGASNHDLSSDMYPDPDTSRDNPINYDPDFFRNQSSLADTTYIFTEQPSTNTRYQSLCNSLYNHLSPRTTRTPSLLRSSYDASGMFYTTLDMNSALYSHSHDLSKPAYDDVMIVEDPPTRYDQYPSPATDVMIAESDEFLIGEERYDSDSGGSNERIFSDIASQSSEAELQNVRRRSMSDNNLTAPRTSPRAPKNRFRRTLSLSKKRPKGGALRPACPDHVVAGNLAHAQTQGYVEKCHKGALWQRVWCVLRAGTLYVFTSPSDDGAQDTLLLSECTFRQYTDGYKQRQHVVEITHKPYCPEYIAMETHQEISDWLGHLKDAVLEASVEVSTRLSGDVTMATDRSRPLTYTSLDSSVLPSSEWDELYSKETDPRDCFDDRAILSPDTAQRELILEKKQRLLQEMLHQKQQLQDRADKSCKDTDAPLLRRRPSASDQSPQPQTLEICPRQQAANDEQQWRELIMLKQRKMSTELKVDTLRRILDSCESKNQKKAKLRLPKDFKRLKKSSSMENLCDVDGRGHSAEEIQHWVSQLQTLRNELGSLTSEIVEREQRHTWYPGLPVDGQRSEPAEARSISLLSERSLFRHNLTAGNIRKPSSSSAKSEGCFDDEKAGSRRSDGSPGSKVIYKTWEPRTRLHGQNSNSSAGEGKKRLKSQTSSSSTTESKSILKAQHSASSLGDSSQKTENQTANTLGSTTLNINSKTRLRAQDSNSSVATTVSAASTAVCNTSLDSKSEAGSIKNLSRLNVMDSPRSRSSRLQKITALGKKIPSLPSLRRGIFRKNNSCDKDDATSPILAEADRRCSYDIIQTQLPPIDCHKRASLDERLVLACRHSSDPPNSPPIQEESSIQPHMDQNSLSPRDLEVFQVVPPNSRRSSDGDVSKEKDKVSSNVSSPTTPGFNKADSLLSSVMQALHSIRSEANIEPRLRSQSSSGRLPSQTSEPKSPSTVPPTAGTNTPTAFGTTPNTSTKISPDSNHNVPYAHHNVSILSSHHNVSALTEASVETDSGRGSPLSPELPFCPGSGSPASVVSPSNRPQTPAEGEPVVKFRLGSVDDVEQRSSVCHQPDKKPHSKLEIDPQALANIAAFEQLIHERLKYV